jgi:multiple sugar transport system substrate-binding protein
MLIMRKTRLSIILFFSIFLLIGYTVASAQVTEINMWFGRQDFIPADAFETFHKNNPDIHVNVDVIPLQDVSVEFVKAYQANRAPDIFQLTYSNLPPLAQRGWLQDISPVVEKWEKEDPEDFSTIDPIAFEMASIDNVVYGMTMHAGAPYLAYRMDLYEEKNLSEPQTWDDVLEAARIFRSEDMLGHTLIGSRRNTPLWFTAEFMSRGGEFIDNIPQLDSEAGISLIKFYQTLMREDLIHPDTLTWGTGEFRAAFIGGNAPQFFEAENIYPTVQENYEYGVEWKVVAPPFMPGAEEKRSLGAWGWPYFVTKGTDLDAVEKIFKYLSKHEIVKEVAQRYQPTTRLTVAEDPEYLAAQPWAEDIAKIKKEVKGLVVPMHLRQPEINEVLLDAMQDALANPEVDAAEMAAKHQEALNLIGNK